MKTHTPRTKGLRVLSMSALALVLGHAPVHLDLNGFGLQVTQAYADSGSSCFVANTRVRMADGSLRAIETIKVGDRVLGRDGRVNAVVAVERVPLGARKLYAFNGGRPFVTQEHPFMTRHGWRSIEPASTREENPQLRVAPLREGDQLLVWSAYTAATPIIRGNLALAAASEEALEAIALTRIEAFAAPPDTTLYNLLLDGDHVYFADDFLVHNKGGDGGGGGSGSDSGGGGGGGDSGSDSGGGSSGGGNDSGGGSGPGGSDDDSASHSGRGGGDDDSGSRSGRGGGDDDSGSHSGRGGSDDDSGSHSGRGGGSSSAVDSGRGRGRGEHAEAEHAEGEHSEVGHGRGRGRGRGEHAAAEHAEAEHDEVGHGRGRGRGAAPGRGRGQDAEVEHGPEIGHRQRRRERSSSAPSSSAALASGRRNTASAQVASEVAPAGAALSAGEEAAAIAGNWGRSVRQ